METSKHSSGGLIIGSQLNRARELLQLTPVEAAKAINASPQELERWEKGDARPSLSQLEALAILYGRELDYFLKETPAPPSAIEFRGKPGQSLKNLLRETKIVLARFDELCRSAAEFEKLLGKKHEVRIAKLKSSENPKILAQHLREEYELDDKPVTNLKELLANNGVRIFELAVSSDEISGFAFWHSVYGPCILLNARDIKGRKNFTLAHELAHLLYSNGASLCYVPSRLSEIRENVEYKANQLAIEFLLPSVGIEKDFQKKNSSRTPTETELAQIAYKWAVSIQALGYRLEDLDLIKKGHTNTLLEPKPHYFPKKGHRTPSWEKQLGQQFVKTSIEAYQKHYISISKLAHALGIPIRKAMERAEAQRK